jgi:hypothetical protein
LEDENAKDYQKFVIEEQYLKLIEKIIKNKDKDFQYDTDVNQNSNEIADLSSLRIPPL